MIEQKIILKKLGFLKSDVDSNLYFKVVDNQPLILVLYVDDVFLTREEIMIAECNREITSVFEMKDLGVMHYFLGLDIWQKNDDNGFYIKGSTMWTSCVDLAWQTMNP